MCGITGIIGPGHEDKSLLARMMDRIAHRGPDDTGTYVDDACALGHARLSIIDLTGGHEPILDADGQRAIIYNGEIYNHEALRQQLEGKGHAFKTHSDAEVPLHAIARGIDPSAALRSFDGMFAFAIWDATTKRLLAARDPYGIKPFFYTHVDGAFLFASEMKALLAHPGFEARVSPDAVREKAVFEYLLPGTTWLEGVYELPPGHYLETDGTRVSVHKYHEDARMDIPSDRDAMADQLYGILVDSVKKRLMSEVPLGVVLSGGLDSSLIAAINRDLDPDRTVTTFSVAEDDRNEDFQKARQVADAIGTEHHEWHFEREDLDRDLASVVWSTEDIDHETYFFYPLFRQMKSVATVGLCGQGADEVFGGYPRYKNLATTRAELSMRTAAAYGDATHHNALLSTHYDTLADTLEWERGAQLANFQLRLVDRNSMAFGTEIRVPFLDKQVVAFGRSLTPEMWIGEGTEKLALRLAARRSSLPRDIVDRPKIPAGRSTARSVIESFEHDVNRAYTDARAKAHPYAAAFRKKTELLMLDLFEETFVHRRGEAPGKLTWTDLV